MNEEGITSANQSQPSAARDPVTGAIVRRWWLLAVASAAQVGVAAALRVFPLKGVWSGTHRCRLLARFFVRESSERVAWAIEATGRRLPRASSCLARALVTEMLLDPTEGSVHLHIGVRHTDAGAFQAHAWVTRADRVVVGAPADGYAPIVIWTRALD